MNKIVSNFYLIKLEDNPVYVGYTNRPIKQRFSEHKRDKDFGDIEPTVENLGSLEYTFTWDMELISQYAKEVSDREDELILDYNTKDSIWQKGTSGKLGGQTWANVKYFVRTNRDNPKFKGLSEEAILAYLEDGARVSRYIGGFVSHMDLPETRYMKDFVSNMNLPENIYMHSFVSHMDLPETRYIRDFVNAMKLPETRYIGDFVSHMDLPETRYMKDFVSHMNLPETIYMRHFVSTMNLPVVIYISSFVNRMNLPENIYMHSFVGNMKLPETRYINDFVRHMKKAIDN